MKFTLLSLVAPTLAKLVTFKAISEDNLVRGSLQLYHETAGISFFFVGRGAGPAYQLEDGYAFRNVSGTAEHVGLSSFYLGVGLAVVPLQLEFDGNVLTNAQFWACMDTNDPNNVSAILPAVTFPVSDRPHGEKCKKITIYKEEVE